MLHLHVGLDYNVDTALPPVQGPLLPEQIVFVEYLELSILDRGSFDRNQPDALTEARTRAEDRLRRRQWLTDHLGGRKHFCPGYYSCLTCYPD